MSEKKIYFGLSLVAVAALLLTAVLVYKASRLSQNGEREGESVSTLSAVLGEQEEATSAAVYADLVLNFGEARAEEQRLATYSAVRVEGKTALDLLLQAAEKNNFKVDYENQSFGVFIRSIDGVANQKSVFWLYYVNGLPAPVAADKQVIGNGDRVEFRFTSSL